MRGGRVVCRSEGKDSCAGPGVNRVGECVCSIESACGGGAPCLDPISVRRSFGLRDKISLISVSIVGDFPCWKCVALVLVHAMYDKKSIKDLTCLKKYNASRIVRMFGRSCGVCSQQRVHKFHRALFSSVLRSSFGGNGGIPSAIVTMTTRSLSSSLYGCCFVHSSFKHCHSTILFEMEVTTLTSKVIPNAHTSDIFE